MGRQETSRRHMLKQSGTGLAGIALLQSSWLPVHSPAGPVEEVVPWLDQPPPNPGGAVGNLQPSEELASYLTPNEKFFSVAHYNRPVIDEKAWGLDIVGQVKHPIAIDLSTLKARPRQESNGQVTRRLEMFS